MRFKKPFRKISKTLLNALLSSPKENTASSRITLRYVAGTKANTLGLYFKAFIKGFDNTIEVAGKTPIISSQTFR
jgi:hypothetical protein